jgi:putative ABC transport system permease protein
MNVPPTSRFLRPLVWCLQTLTSRTRAEAILGDIHEDVSDTLSPGHRWWRVNWTLCRYIVVAMRDALPQAARTTGFLVRDIARGLRASAGTSTLTIVILGAATTVATVTYSVVDAVVLTPLPYAEPERLVMMQRRVLTVNRDDSGRKTPMVHAAVFEALQRPSDAFDAVAGYGTSSYRLESGETLGGAEVTASLFHTLRTSPMLGTGFTAPHERVGADNVVVLSHAAWVRHFSADPNIVGRTITLTERPHVVVGVMPIGFVFPVDDDGRPQVWTPFVRPTSDTIHENAARLQLTVIGRLASGSSLAPATDAANAAIAAFAPNAGGRLDAVRVELVSLSDAVVGPVRDWMLLALLAVGAVLLIACANVANLLLARSARRSRELSVRASLGASRRFLATTAIGEGVVLSLLAWGVGLLATWWVLEAVRSALPADIARTSSIAVNSRVLIVALVTSIVTGVTFSAAPARVAARQDLRAVVARTATSTRRTPWRMALVGTQVAFVTLLMIISTLFVASFVRVLTKDLGFSRHDSLVATRSGITTPAYDVAGLIRTVPGVVASGGYSRGDAPLTGGGQMAVRVWRPGGPEAVNAAEMQITISVTPGYLPAAGATFLAGRDFEDDDLGRRDRIIIDDATATRLYPDGTAVGRPLAYGMDAQATIVGVIAGMRTEGPETPATPMLYQPLARDASTSTWLVRASRDPHTVSTSVASVLDGLSGSSTPDRKATITRLDDVFREMTRERRFVATVMSLFGVLALAIGATGIYGVLWSTVSQRTREFAIRSALGGSRRHIVGTVLRDAVRMVIGGLVVGLALGFAVGRTVSSLLFEVQVSSPAWYLIVATAMLLGCLASALIPARRAASVDPQVALRAE